MPDEQMVTLAQYDQDLDAEIRKRYVLEDQLKEEKRKREELEKALRELIRRIDHPDGLYALPDWDTEVDKARATLAREKGERG